MSNYVVLIGGKEINIVPSKRAARKECNRFRTIYPSATINWQTQNNMAEITVNIILGGRSWTMQVVSGKVDHLPNVVIADGQTLVNYCNNHKIQVLNKKTLRPEFREQLKY